MITFIHLSDIHFTNRDHGTQFDLDQRIRRALLDDLEARPNDVTDYDALLITGDIAYAGSPKEYKIAQDFLDEIFERTGVARKNTLMVPGNHDVDRKYVEPDLPLWAAHQKLRESDDPTVWRDHIYKQLVKDPQRSLLAPLTAYNTFAQGYGCYTGMLPPKKSGDPEIPQLAWTRVFEQPLGDGMFVRIDGLNSALVSDAADSPGKLLVSEYQTSNLLNREGFVNLLMCHHPPDWLMDKKEVRTALRSFTHVALFGHEHDSRVNADKKQVQLFAGAVQPSRRDPNWVPTYHVLQLRLEATGLTRELVVKVHTREFTTSPSYRFRPKLSEDDEKYEEHRIQLPPKKTGSRHAVGGGEISAKTVIDQSNTYGPEPSVPTQLESSRHELLVNFFQLHTPHRYHAAFTAGLLRDGDDALDPHVMWAEVFQRAVDENKLEAFWNAVAPYIPAMKSKSNPFTTNANP